VQEHEPEIFKKADVFLLSKDYLCYRMTGQIHAEYSDAAGTLLLDIKEKVWSEEICELFHINPSICPPLVESHHLVGTITAQFASETGLSEATKVFAGGADNACGVIGAGILSEGKTLCSIGTSGVILSYEQSRNREFGGKVHYFNHGKEDVYYTMGVTLSVGHSLSWFKDTFAKDEDFETLLHGLENVPAGATAYFIHRICLESGHHMLMRIFAAALLEWMPHTRIDFARAVMEGITFSLCESINIFRESGKKIDTIVSIGGGAKNDTWLQMQADIFDAVIVKLENEQGPAMGAAMLAAYGSGWFFSLEECANQFIRTVREFHPNEDNVKTYKALFEIYKTVYENTKNINKMLKAFRG